MSVTTYLNLTVVSTNLLYFLNCLNAGKVLMTKMWAPPGGESSEKTFRYRLTYSPCSLNSRFMRSSYFKVPENKGKLILRLTNLPKTFKVSNITSLGKNYDFWKWRGAKFNQVPMRVPGNHRNQTYVLGHRGVPMSLEPWCPLSAIQKPLEMAPKKLLPFYLEESESLQAGEKRKCVSYPQGSKGYIYNSDSPPHLDSKGRHRSWGQGGKQFQVHIWKNLLLKTIFQIMERAALGESEFPISVSIQAEGGDLLVRIATERIQAFREWPGLQYPFSPSVPGTEWVSTQ